MSDAAIRVDRLTKIYRRFSSNSWRAASLLGLPVPRSRYDTFCALDGVSLTVGRGERVALVGRNGAGKSTLLRHISGELTPTSGSVGVSGKVKALFNLGEGFHPEFSAMQNLRTGLAIAGVRQAQIARTIDEIIEFTELDEFAERPLKEYSAGMYARLAFAMATATQPEILIIDEILGAGDAYFVGKCVQRVREITSEGTTVLFVSHDMGSAQMLCSRGIWLHQGRVRQDGSMTMVARAYAAHIRAEQELLLRSRTMRLSKRSAASHAQALLLRFICAGETAPAEPLHVARLAFGAGDVPLGTTVLGSEEQNGAIAPIVDPAAMNWGKSIEHAGRRCRAFGDFGGRFGHAPFAITSRLLGGRDAWIEIEAAPSRSTDVLVQFYREDDQRYETIGTIPADAHPVWQTWRFPLAGDSPAPAEAMAEADPGSDEPEPAQPIEVPAGGVRKPVAIVDFCFLDEDGARRHTLLSGRPAGARLRIRADARIAEGIAVVAIYATDGTCISQCISSREGVTVRDAEGDIQIDVWFDELLIGPGDYLVSSALFRHLDPAVLPEERAYDLLDRSYALKILDADLDPFPGGLVRQKAQWSWGRSADNPKEAYRPANAPA